MSALRGAQARRLMETFRREGRVEVGFSGLRVAVYWTLGLGLLACGLVLMGGGIHVISTRTGKPWSGIIGVVMGLVPAVLGLLVLALGLALARPSRPPVVADAEGVHVQGGCVPWTVISGFGTSRHEGRGPNSHLLATIVVDKAAVTAWTAERGNVDGGLSRLHPLASPGPDGISLPFNLAVGARQLSEALEAIRLEVVGVSE
ncbi:hypothetical protein [Terrabacter carboxydivorans]|uniref:Uncharacterized protein n=1 Tax=Terrabacter carboxydivorans TaxID=619730 RepID=A0ABP5YUP7_9MICO